MGRRKSHFLGILHAQVRRKEEVKKKGVKPEKNPIFLNKGKTVISIEN